MTAGAQDADRISGEAVMKVRTRSRILVAVAIACAIVGAAVAVLFSEARRVAVLTPVPATAPTHVFARPPVLAIGLRPDAQQVRLYLERLGYTEAPGPDIEPGEYDLTSGRWRIGRRPFPGGQAAAPPGVVEISLDYGGRIRRLVDAAGRRVRFVALEPQLLGRLAGPSAVFRVPVELDRLPEHLTQAVLTTEDHRFFEHAGLDAHRIAAAFIANLRAGRVVQGGSTITQQLAKNLYLTPRRTWLRKAREAAIALVLERRYSKHRILAAYLNEVYLGQDGGVAVHGVGAAARFYFGRDIEDLHLAESALLAGLIRGPSLYAPTRDAASASARRDLVLRLMRDRGVISESAFAEATATEIDVHARATAAGHARYFVDYVRSTLEASGATVDGSGLAVFTTLDDRFQRMAESAVEDGLAMLESRYPGLVRSPAEGSPLQAALVAIDPRTGEILAMVGGRDYGSSQFNRAVHARRQPGSAFKPVVTLAALADGGSFTLASLLDDAPLTVETRAGPWRPVNYDERFRGPITLRAALEKSLNVPFARLGLAIGPERIVEVARRLGIDGPLMPVPSLALGASEVSPLELTRAYGVLAAGGYRADGQTVLGVVYPDGRLLDTPDWAGTFQFDDREAYLVTSALRGVVARGTGRSLAQHGFYGDVAAKSGTTNDFRDGWFVGFTPRLTIGVWVGFDDGRSLGVPGARVALPIFADFLTRAVGGYGDEGDYASAGFRRPSGMEVVEVDASTGLRAGPGCRGELELFMPGTAPRRSCSPYYRGRRRSDARSSLRLE